MEESGHYAAVETLSLEQILITEHLATRPSRTPDYQVETQAIHTLTQALAMGSSGLLQSLVETAVLLCHAGTAGISILEETGATRVFRWCNMAGELAGQAGQSTPAEFSPCGVTLALDTPQLFDRPYRHFTYFQAFPAPIEEGLVIPLRTPGQPPATIWIVSHDPLRAFDREDLRVMTQIASFTAAVLKLMATTDENERLYREAKEAMAGRDSLIATIAHDLKTPLTSLKGRSQLLTRRARRLAAPGVQEIQQGLEELPRLVDRMVRQIDELLDVSRLRAGQPLELRVTAVDAVVLVRQCIEEVRLSTGTRRIRLEVRSPEITGRWDRDRLQRVLGNLLANAMKYSPAGGEILVEVSREDLADQSWCRIVVRDHGIGIPAADVTKVFHPYWRSEDVKENFGGNGIGLTSVLQIIELHGGTIRVESEEGQGSTFSIQLPLAIAEAVILSA